MSLVLWQEAATGWLAPYLLDAPARGNASIISSPFLLSQEKLYFQGEEILRQLFILTYYLMHYIPACRRIADGSGTILGGSKSTSLLTVRVAGVSFLADADCFRFPSIAPYLVPALCSRSTLCVLARRRWRLILADDQHTTVALVDGSFHAKHGISASATTMQGQSASIRTAHFTSLLAFAGRITANKEYSKRMCDALMQTAGLLEIDC